MHRTLLKTVRKNLLILLAMGGIVSAILFSRAHGSDKFNQPNSLTTPPSSAFVNSISGIGFVEASSKNINIGAFMPGIVSDVPVTEGQEIKIGDVLFVQDQRSALAEIQLKKDDLNTSLANLELAKIEYADREDNLKRGQGLKSGHSISEEELMSRKFAVEKAIAEIKIKENQVKQAVAALKMAEIALDKTIVRSPLDGLVLKVRIRAGEFINGNEQDFNAPILIGAHKPLHIRVQIDENDLWRFEQSMPAYAYLRSNKNVSSPISFIRIEPYATNKNQLRGTGTELIDTRIVEIIYKIDHDIKNLFIGQQMDVFIESRQAQ